jgi:FkbM family methyltransferase
MKKQLTLIIGVFLVVLAIGWQAASAYDAMDWRMRLLSKKLTGRAANIPMSDLLRAVAKTGTEREGTTHFQLEVAEHGAPPCDVRWATLLGSFWGRQSDAYQLDMIVIEQLTDEYRRDPVLVKPGDVVVDVGAHLGVFTRVALDSGARLVVAFEPDPVNSVCFERTYRDDIKAGRVLLVKAAAWDREGELNFGGHGISAHVTGPSGDVIVDATTIDKVVADQKLDRVDFIKMDIEGSETRALAGAQRTLAAFGPKMAVCIYHRPTDPVEVPRVVLGANPAYKSFTNRTKTQTYFFLNRS